MSDKVAMDYRLKPGSPFEIDASIEDHISKMQAEITRAESAAWDRIAKFDHLLYAKEPELFMLRRRAVLAQFELEVMPIREEIYSLRKHMINLASNKPINVFP